MVVEETVGHAALDGAALAQRQRFAYAMAYDPVLVAMQLRAIQAAANALVERDLATPDLGVQAILAELGRSGAFARLQLYARRAHHQAEVAQIERTMLAAAMADVGMD